MNVIERADDVFLNVFSSSNTSDVILDGILKVEKVIHVKVI